MKLGYDISFSDIKQKFIFSNDIKNCDSENKCTETKDYFNEPIQNIFTKLKTDMKDNVILSRLEIENESINSTNIFRANILAELSMKNAKLFYFTSDWGNEFHPEEKLLTENFKIGTYSGRSTKGCDTVFFVINGDEILGVAVGWSGNWEAKFSIDDTNLNISIGMPYEKFSHELHSGSAFENIEIYMCLEKLGSSSKVAATWLDTEKVAKHFRKYYKNNISLWKDDVDTLPFIFNTWWQFEDKLINEDVFYKNSKIAKEIGLTNSTLDAGWFGPSEEIDEKADAPWFKKRGDWDAVNTKLFPNGMKNLGDKINGLGINFGIWCEIEAVGEDAQFNFVHSNLVAKRDNKSLGYVCMGSHESVKWALEVMKTLILDYKAKWIKFDFNLDPGDGCDCQEHGHGKSDGLYAHYKGYYYFLEELHRLYPEVIIENCSSGGLRLDLGVMKRSHVGFLSDPDYTPHHLKCLWGTLSFMHQSSCLHFSWSETTFGDHNMGIKKPITDVTPLSELDYMMRAVLIGVPGISQKLTDLPNWAKKRIAEYVKLYKKISIPYILNGELTRLTPQTITWGDGGSIWNGYEIENQNGDALLFIFKTGKTPENKNFKLTGLDTEKKYSVLSHNTGITTVLSGEQLMNIGIDENSNLEHFSEILEINLLN